MLIRAIVIKKVPMREHDELVTLYCRELGKMTALAKGVLKPRSVQALQLDPGNIIQCELVSGRGASIITGAQALVCQSNAKASQSRHVAVHFFLQVVDAMMYDHQQDTALYDCLCGILSELNRVDDESALATFRRSQEVLLEVLGYGTAGTAGYAGRGRTEVDDAYERIAQRHLETIDLFYEMLK